MASGGLFAWAWLPELQTSYTNEKGKQVLRNKKLEDLAGGIRSARREGEVTDRALASCLGKHRCLILGEAFYHEDMA